MEDNEIKKDEVMLSGGLTLEVREKTLGTLITNALEIREFVERRLEDYTPEKYEGDADQAAKDRAELNKAADKLNSDRLALEKEWMRPFNDLKSVIDDTVRKIKTASSRLSVIVDARKREERAAKQEAIDRLWADKGFTLVPLDRVQDQRWLNKTARLTAISSEMDAIISRISQELGTLDEFGDDRDDLKAFYLETLSLPSAVERGRRLRENRRRIAEEEAERQRACLKPCAGQTAAEDAGSGDDLHEADEADDEETGEKADHAEPVMSVIFTGADLRDVHRLSGHLRHENVLMVSGTAGELRALSESLKDNGVVYEKATECVIRIK